MKKLTGLLLGTALFCGMGCSIVNMPWTERISAHAVSLKKQEETTANCAKSEDLQLRAKASYLMDYQTNSVMYAHNERAHLPIASMCKIMTLLLSFDAVKEGTLTIDEEICISERAASMGGSQVFLEANAKYPVRELLKSIVVCSANDSCVALAERIAGNESIFIERMNEKAKQLGATDTLFANCTGLPKDPQYSCAKDVALMLKALLSHEQYFAFGKVWTDKFAHPKGRYTEITNTNKLVRFYDGCDGGKTGFTNEAGFCLAATAKRGDMRVISVVIGEESSANRFEDIRTMLDYAFANYTITPIFQAGVPLEQVITVSGGKSNNVGISPQRSAYSFAKRGEKPNVTTEIRLDKLKAPFAKGEKAGEMIVFTNGIETDRIPLLTSEGVDKANLFDCFQEIGRNWNAR